MRGAPTASRAKVESTRVSHHRYAETVRHSLRDGFNGFLRALLGDRALLSPSPARCAGIIANLTPASGRQDHTTLPSAPARFVFARRCVHRIPHPTFVTIAKRPSCGCGTAPLIELILPNGEAKSFCSKGWTPNRLDSPAGKSGAERGLESIRHPPRLSIADVKSAGGAGPPPSWGGERRSLTARDTRLCRRIVSARLNHRKSSRSRSNFPLAVARQG